MRLVLFDLLRHLSTHPSLDPPTLLLRASPPEKLLADKRARRRVFDPYAPLLLNLYHYLEQDLHFELVPENRF